MLFQFGEKGEVREIEPYKNVILSLSKLPENNYIKVRAGLYVKNKLRPAYNTTWVLEKTYRAIYLLRLHPGFNEKIKLVKERVELAGFGIKKNPPRQEATKADADADAADGD